MSGPKPRLLYANRCQGELRAESLEQLLPPEHPVRDVWHFVGSLDLSDLLARIKSRPGHVGAPAIDPAILLALWMFATTQGIGSSRVLAQLCEEHLAYRWLCGGVPVGYHTLSDFRTGHAAVLEGLLSAGLAALMHEGLVDLQRVAQDGLRVRASAGASSCRRGGTIQECLSAAQQQVQALRAQIDEDAGAAGRRAQAARQRAAQERVARLQAAQSELERLRHTSAEQPPSRTRDADTIRVSTTDPECRKMKMPDGGFRPAYNVQFATDVGSGLIVGVDVTQDGTDANQMVPMVRQIEKRLGAKPQQMLVDGGFATRQAIAEVQRGGTTVYAPVREGRKQIEAGQDPYERKKGDTDEVANWRARMATAEAKEIYKQRASTAEWTNAQARNRGLYQVRVRGRAKVLVVVLWYALVHNFTRLASLRRAQPAEAGETGT
jgi:transposase